MPRRLPGESLVLASSFPASPGELGFVLANRLVIAMSQVGRLELGSSGTDQGEGGDRVRVGFGVLEAALGSCWNEVGEGVGFVL
jgi:hypothetical protein